MNEAQRKATNEMRKKLMGVAEILNETADNLAKFVADYDWPKEATTPDGWQLPKDKQLTVSATNARRRVEAVDGMWQTKGGAMVVEDDNGYSVYPPANERWQIGDHEFSDEWEVEG